MEIPIIIFNTKLFVLKNPAIPAVIVFKLRIFLNIKAVLRMPVKAPEAYNGIIPKLKILELLKLSGNHYVFFLFLYN